jgi:hypothetical protein
VVRGSSQLSRSSIETSSTSNRMLRSVPNGGVVLVALGKIAVGR